MTQENQGTNSAVPDDTPVKRKRGRPRKDRSQTQGQMSATSAPDTEKRSQRRRIDLVTETKDDLVGRTVFGVLDGSFDAGYLLTVKVENTDTVLKGVVFQPGSSVAISGSNDVAPHMKMLRRADIQINQVDRETHPHGSSGQCAQMSKRPNGSSQRSGDFLSSASQPVKQVPVVSPQPSPSQNRTAEEMQNGTNNIRAAEGHSGSIHQIIPVTSQERDIGKSEQNDIFPKDYGALPPAGLTDADQGSSDLNVKPASAVDSSTLDHGECVKKAMLPVTKTPSAVDSSTLDQDECVKAMLPVTKAPSAVDSSTLDHDECVKKAMLPVAKAPSGLEAPSDQTETSPKILPDQLLQVEDKPNKTVEASVDCQTTIIDAPHPTVTKAPSADDSSTVDHDECVKKAMLPVTKAPSGLEAPSDQTETSAKILPDQLLQVEDKPNKTVEAAVECQTTIIDVPHPTSEPTTESEDQTPQTVKLHELLPNESVPAAIYNLEAVDSANVKDLQKDFPKEHLSSSTVPTGSRDLVSEEAGPHVELQSTPLESKEMDSGKHQQV